MHRKPSISIEPHSASGLFQNLSERQASRYSTHMIPVARRLLLRNRGGLIVTVSGVAATVALVLFLFAVHDGAKDGSTRYVRTAEVDIWISQKNADNILKSSSFLDASLAGEIGKIEGVKVASPLARLITKADIEGDRKSTRL